MNRRAEVFFDAITLLREDLVEDAQNYAFRKRRSGWRKFGSLAACLILVVSLGMLAALPKGCGGAGVAPGDMNSSGSPSKSPAEMPPSANEDMPYGDGAANVDTAPSSGPPAGENPPAEEEMIRFTVQILEVLEDGLLAELLPEDSRLLGAERVRIAADGLDSLPALRPGDIVYVSCRTASLEDGEAVAEDVTELRLVERP